MHCNGIAHQYSDTAAWRQSMVIETIAYWAVPVYFMISGATLLDYRDKYLTRVFFKKRFLKTGIPFAAWTLISLAYKIQFQQMEFEPGLSQYRQPVYQYNSRECVLVFHSAVYGLPFHAGTVAFERLQAYSALYGGDGVFGLFCLPGLLYCVSDPDERINTDPCGRRIYSICHSRVSACND